MSLLPSVTGKAERANGIFQRQISKLAQTTGLPWLTKVLLLAIDNSQYHPWETYTHSIGRPKSIGMQLSADPLPV